MSKIIPILLAGGSGKRLWPLSRGTYPKQFSKLVGTETLFQQSALRSTSSHVVEFAPHITITNSDHRFIIREQLQEVGIEPSHILIEPSAKNTSAAVLAASLYAYADDPDAILLITPSDHVIPDIDAFHHALKVGSAHARSGKIVTFGIVPTRAETGYGYLELDSKQLDSEGTKKVGRFVEKPEYSNAKQMLADGSYLWNAGIFLFKASEIIKAFNTFAQDTMRLTEQAVNSSKIDLGFVRLNPKPWAKLRSNSIDFEIMEKADNLVAVPYMSKWSDLGDWNAVWSELEKDQMGVVTSNSAHAFDCSNSLLRSENPDQQLIGLGLDGVIAVAMPDAVLVARKDKTQDVKHIVDNLRAQNIRQAETFPIDYRPWGWFESLAIGGRFQVKRIYVNPNAALSLQSHKHRSEHWVIVDGVAKVTVDKDVSLLSEGQSIYIPVGSIHRLENTGEKPLVLIEVQTGSYLGEDDIVRYEDLYARQ